MKGYLNADELADLVDCKPNSFACMRRWLDRNGWPYMVSTTGFPKVARSYHDKIMLGQAANMPKFEVEPDLSWI